MAFLCVDLLKFPDEETEKKFEEECKKWVFDGRVIFNGRIARDPWGRFTHAMVWKFEDFSSGKDVSEQYANSLENSSNPVGDFAAYSFSDWWGFRVAALDDPIVKEHGIDEWTRREANRESDLVYKNPARVAQWHEALYKKFEKLWPREALIKSGWIKAPPSTPK